jgi:hypothetical protein
LYLMHYQLLEHMTKGLSVMLRLNFFLLVGFYLFWREFPLALASLDFAFTVLTVIFLFTIKPKILRGEIPAYYRRDYSQMKVIAFLIQFFIQGALMRFGILSLYYGITLYLVRETPSDVARYQEVVMEIVLNPSMWLLAVVGFALAMYVVFYHERYASIREFSNSVVDIYNSYTYTEEGAVKEFIRRKDGELELFAVNGVKYDGATQQPSYETYTQADNHVFTEYHSEESTTVLSEESSVHQEGTPIVRRKARK